MIVFQNLRRDYLSLSTRTLKTNFLGGIFLITIFRLFVLIIYPPDLSTDEAQYWVWSQYLSWGYHSKPPLVAWVIHLSTIIFGNSPFAIRFVSLLAYSGSSYFVYTQ